jgi:3-(3-hydroxy-phenyl)propionate hydroxylase
MNQKTQVFISGAGPSGLAAALFFAKNGVPVRIIDKNRQRSDKSKALGVQAGTLESIDYYLDPEMTKKMITQGQKVSSAYLHIDHREPITVDLSVISSNYNFVLILPQSETERILEEALEKYGVKVERNTELVDFEQNDNRVLIKLSGETARADFLLGCDGAHSTVRHKLNFSFKGSPYDGDFILGDVQVNWPWPKDSIRIFINAKGTIACFPIKGGMYRLVLIPKFSKPSKESDMTSAEFQSITRELSGGKIETLDPQWMTRFRVHHRLAERFRNDRVFLVGDAAHIHSPAGGQGMNTGIQDALILAQKLTKVIQGKEAYSSLDNYEKERRPIAKSVLRATDLVSRMGLAKENALLHATRRYLIPKIVKFKPFQRYVAHGISEVGIARKQIQKNPSF